MRIIGNGLIARSLRPYADSHSDNIAFARGVSTSTCESRAEFARERALLDAALSEARRTEARIIYFSGGGAIYGWTHAANEGSPLAPRTAYGHHQVRCEEMIAGSGVRYLVARLPNVVGAGANVRQLIPSLVRQSLDGRVQVQVGAERDLVDADDVGPVVLKLLARVSDYETVNVASGISTSVATIVDEICSILGIEPAIVPVLGGERQRFSTDHLSELIGHDQFLLRGTPETILAKYVPELAHEMRRGMA